MLRILERESEGALNQTALQKRSQILHENQEVCSVTEKIQFAMSLRLSDAYAVEVEF